MHNSLINMKLLLRILALLAIIGCTQDASAAGGGESASDIDLFLDNPLIVAIDAGDAGAVTALLASGANPNTQSTDGLTALMFAAQRDNPACVQALLAGHNGRRADPNARTVHSRDTGLMLAIRTFNRQNVPLLISASSAGLAAENRAGETPLSIAVNTRQLDIVNLLIAAGVRVDAAAHHDAIQQRNPAMTTALRIDFGDCKNGA